MEFRTLVASLLFLVTLAGARAASASPPGLPDSAEGTCAPEPTHNVARDDPPGGSHDIARPKIGLVLGGGGARGAAHVGVLKVLEEMRVPVDCVVGTSMGSVVGGLYASGISPEEIQRILVALDWGDLFSDAPAREAMPFRHKEEDREGLFDIEFGVRPDGLHLPSGLASGQKVTHLLKLLTLGTTGVESFDDLPIPFRSVACDLKTGSMVVLSEGSLGDAMRASLSVPGVLSPTELDGRLLVDGGIVRNLPIDVAMAMGADVVIAVDVSSATSDRTYDSILAIFRRGIAIMTAENVLAQTETLTGDDVLVVPELGEMSSTDFTGVADAIAIGESNAREHASQLSAYSVCREAYGAYLERLRSGMGTAANELVVDEIRVTGADRVSDRIIERVVRTKTGVPLDVRVLRGDLGRICELGDFESVDFDIVQEGERRVLAIDANEKTWGPTSLRLRLKLKADFRGENEYDLLAYLRTARVNKPGAEWRTRASFGSVNELRTELHQPLDYGGFLFVNPQIRVERRDVGVSAEDGARSEYRIGTQEASLDAGVQFGTCGELRVGTFMGHVTADVRSGHPELEDGDRRTGGWTARMTFDQIDNPSFPRSGSVLIVDGVFNRERFGSDRSFHRIRADGRHAFTLGRNTCVAAWSAGTSLDSNMPIYEEFTLGGFLSLSGFEPGQLRGPRFCLIDLIYFSEISKLPDPVGSGVYMGVSLEAGGVWRDLDDVAITSARLAGSVFISSDSAVGPLCVAFGWAEGGNVSVYLSLGGFLGSG